MRAKSWIVKVVISFSIQLPENSRAAQTAAAFGTKDRVASWIWVTDWNREMAKPTARAVSRTGAHILAAMVMAPRPSSMIIVSVMFLCSGVSARCEEQTGCSSVRPGPDLSDHERAGLRL